MIRQSDSGSSLLEVVVAMAIIGFMGVALTGAAVLSRPVTDRMVFKSKLNQQVNVYLDNIRTRKFISCTATNAGLVDNLYPFKGSGAKDSLKTEVFYNNHWIPCSRSFFKSPTVDGVNFDATDLTNIGQMKIQKVTITKTNKSGKDLVRVIVKTNN